MAMRAKPLRGGAAYIFHNDECQSMMRPLCEEKIGESSWDRGDVGRSGSLMCCNSALFDLEMEPTGLFALPLMFLEGRQ